MEKKEREEYVYKFRCKQCKRLLGGIKKNGNIKFLEGTSEYSADGKKTYTVCRCKIENSYDLVGTRKKIFDMNLKSVLESSAKKEREKNIKK